MEADHTLYRRPSAGLTLLLTAWLLNIVLSGIVTAEPVSGSSAWTIQAGGGLSFDSNIFLDNSETRDLITDFNPLVRYSRHDGVVTLETVAGVRLKEFRDNPDQGSQDFHVSLGIAGLNKPQSKLNFIISGVAEEMTVASEELGKRIESRDWRYLVRGQLDLSEKLGLRLGSSGSGKDFLDPVLYDSTDLSGRISALFVHSEKLTLTGSYRYRKLEYDRQADSIKLTTFIIGAEGQLLPKLEGTLEAGITDQNGELQEAFFYTAMLVWRDSPKRTFTLRGGRDNGISVTASNLILTDLTFGASQSLTDSLSVNGSVGVGRFEKGGVGARDDDFLKFSAGLLHAVSQHRQFELNLMYEDRESDLRTTDYRRVVIRIGLIWQF